VSIVRWNLKEAGCGEQTNPRANLWSDEQKSHTRLCMRVRLQSKSKPNIKAGKVYLSPLIDCFDGMPVSWTIGTSPNSELANTMLKKAIVTLNPSEKPIVHSDRGCHYRWPGWIKIMEDAGLIRSMSKKAVHRTILLVRDSSVT